MQALVDQNTQLEVDSLSNRQPVKLVADDSEIGSYFRLLVTSLAATRNTDCSCRMRVSEMPASKLLQ